jgi:hypothetical protein
MNCRVCTVAALVVVSILVTVTIITATTITTGTPMVYAGDYEKSQTIVQTNECGNYWFPLDVLCSNLSSQVQGEKNNIIVEGGEGGAAETEATDQKQDGNVKTSEGKDENSEVSQSFFTPFP